jgi:hypothetical protein
MDDVSAERLPGVDYDEYGEPVGSTVEEWFDKLDRKLTDHFGEEYRELANERRSRWNQKGYHFEQL